jgi:hypothetical protein
LNFRQGLFLGSFGSVGFFGVESGMATWDGPRVISKHRFQGFFDSLLGMETDGIKWSFATKHHDNPILPIRDEELGNRDQGSLSIYVLKIIQVWPLP